MNPKNFFAELKRRNVYKVAVAYAIVGWLLVQIATQVFPFLEIPNWVVRFVIALVAIGFPIALVIAWAFELTPEGIKRTENVDLSGERVPKKHAWIYIALIGAAISVALFFLGRYTAGTPRSAPEELRRDKQSHVATAPEKSIAVLPFENLSDDKSNAYFADGIQEEILTRLSKITDLKVISRTSTQRYKSAPADLREIAKQLGVENVLEGSVQKASDQVRISVQLINALNDSHLWAETYDRKLIDVFQLETDLAQKIAASLEAKLTGKEKTEINARGTDNPQAYETYLRALALHSSQSDADNAHMRDLLREAVRLDPNFAEAWAWLAISESSRYFFPEESPAQKERAHSAAETALRLAPNSADALGGMGLYSYYVEKNYEEALRWLDRARAIAPNDWKFIAATALVKRRQGKLDETIALQKRSAELDPLNAEIWVEIAWSYRGLRDLEQARAMLDRALAISPNDSNIIAAKAETYGAAGDLDKSWEMLRDLKFGPTDDGFGTLLGVLIGRRDYDEAIRRIDAMRQAGNEPPLFQAIDRAGVGRLELAKGNAAAAEPLFHQAERQLAEFRDRHEGGIIVLEQLLQVEACLGRRDEVERLGNQLREMRWFDKWTSPLADERIATAYANMGDADRAIPLLEKVLQESYAGALTPAYLRLDPRYDRIRNDPRFQKLANAQP
jgi:TolB-like protein